MDSLKNQLAATNNDCLIIYNLWAIRQDKVRIAEGKEVISTSAKISIKSRGGLQKYSLKVLV